jgi:HK97 family phage major capsid protein
MNGDTAAEVLKQTVQEHFRNNYKASLVPEVATDVGKRAATSLQKEVRTELEGEFYRHVERAGKDWMQTFKENLRRKAALNIRDASAGGYLIPPALFDDFIMAEHRAIVWPRAMVLPMTRQTLQVATPEVNTTASSSTASEWTGGMKATWEPGGTSSDTIPESEPSLAAIELASKTLTAYAVVGNILLEDSRPAVEDVLQRLIQDTFAAQTDQAFLVGIGGSQPVGVANSPASLAVNRQTGGQVTLNDLAAMIGTLPSRWNQDTTCFVVHPTVYQYLMRIVSVSGHAMQWGTWRGQVKLLVHGIPVETSEFVSVLGTARDVLLCDFSYYAIGSRDLNIRLSAEVQSQFIKLQSVIRFVWRGDGLPWIKSAIVTADGTSTSPFVYLN